MKKELNERIGLNFNRLCNSYYQMEEVFSSPEYDWPGDKEGRALLAFVSHYKINGRINPCMHPMVAAMQAHTNQYGYFGPESREVIFEQQLSGHNWYLRGLCEYYEQFRKEDVLNVLKSTVEHLYYPTMGRFKDYPIERKLVVDGGVSGNSLGNLAGWNLSTDIGCAFMSIDGLSHYYKLTRDHNVKILIDEMIEIYASIDKVKLHAQTHCTLTAARGMLRMYQIEGMQRYLEYAKDILQIYVSEGMTYTYQNYNWWGRGDTWTEPCAIVDSLMLAGELYKITKRAEYQTLAARIYHNGLASAQRNNGGAGTDTTVSTRIPVLKQKMYEAYFCCTMRLAEGLWYLSENQYIFTANQTGTVSKDACGRYMDGNIIYTEFSETMKPYINDEEIRVCEGHTLVPLLKYYKLPDEVGKTIEQRIIYK